MVSFGQRLYFKLPANYSEWGSITSSIFVWAVLSSLLYQGAIILLELIY